MHHRNVYHVESAQPWRKTIWAGVLPDPHRDVPRSALPVTKSHCCLASWIAPVLRMSRESISTLIFYFALQAWSRDNLWAFISIARTLQWCQAEKSHWDFDIQGLQLESKFHQLVVPDQRLLHSCGFVCCVCVCVVGLFCLCNWGCHCKYMCIYK